MSLVSKIISKSNGESGVDLNRNYSFKFAYDEEGSVSDPCDEIYRGESAFSEPETRAVRSMVKKSGKIDAAMNFHAYGNLWITPFCYYKGEDNFSLMKPNIAEFYKDFENTIKEMGFTHVGDAQETIEYTANGEASDWMLASHDIISLSPELGVDKEFSNHFYPDRTKISSIVNEDYRVVDLFLKSCFPSVKDHKCGFLKPNPDEKDKGDSTARTAFKAKHLLRIGVSNKSIAALKGIKPSVTFYEDDFPSNLKRIAFYDGKDITKLSYKIDDINKTIKIKEAINLPKLSEASFYFYFSQEKHFDLTFFLKKDGILIYKYFNYNDNAFFDFFDGLKKQDYTGILTVLWFIAAFALFSFLISYYFRLRRNGSEANVIEIVSQINIERERNKESYIDDDDFENKHEIRN